MWCRPRTNRAAAAIAAACLTGALLSACSDPGLYLDRRDSVALGAGDAVAANAAMQTIDPWPRGSANTNLAANGQRLQSAIERYRTNTVTPPVDPMMMQVANPTPSTPQTASSQSSGSNSSTATAASGSSGSSTSTAGSTTSQ